MSDPTILLHPNIPKPLHGIAPRVIAGRAWWDVERRKAYEAAGFCCEACGVPKHEAKYHRWLEAHEVYEFDYKNGRITFKRLVALCHACHNFIHDGRMRMMVDRGEASEQWMEDILDHGKRILKKAGLLKRWFDRHEITEENCASRTARWSKWRMVFDGVEWGPSTMNAGEWLAGEWKNWTPEIDIERKLDKVFGVRKKTARRRARRTTFAPDLCFPRGEAAQDAFDRELDELLEPSWGEEF